MIKLSDRQLLVLRKLQEYWELNGCSPSVRVLAPLVDLASTNTVSYHLRGLEALGLIVRQFGQARTCHLTPLGKQTLRRYRDGVQTPQG